jgi:hypothetical protein
MSPFEKIGLTADDISYAAIRLTEAVIDCRAGTVPEGYVSECRQLLKNALVEHAAVLQEITP